MPTASRDEIQRALDALPSKTVRALIGELISVRDRFKKGEPVTVPLVTFHLRSGRDVTGWILAGEMDGSQPSLLVHVPGDLRSPGNDIAYLDPAGIEAVTVLDAERALQEISFGRVQVAPGSPTPGKLEIQRRLVALSGEVSQVAGTPIAMDVAWEGIPDTGTAKKMLLDLLEDIAAVLKEISIGVDGRDALAKKVKKVWIGDGPTASVSHQSDTLVVTANFGLGLEGRLIRGALRVEIEKKL